MPETSAAPAGCATRALGCALASKALPALPANWNARRNVPGTAAALRKLRPAHCATVSLGSAVLHAKLWLAAQTTAPTTETVSVDLACASQGLVVKTAAKARCAVNRDVVATVTAAMGSAIATQALRENIAR